VGKVTGISAPVKKKPIVQVVLGFGSAWTRLNHNVGLSAPICQPLVRGVDPRGSFILSSSLNLKLGNVVL